MEKIKEHNIKPKNRWGRGYAIRGGEFDKEACDKMKDKRIILKVTEYKEQRRINIPKSEKTLKKDELVEVKKVKIK